MQPEVMTSPKNSRDDGVSIRRHASTHEDGTFTGRETRLRDLGERGGGEGGRHSGDPARTFIKV